MDIDKNNTSNEHRPSTQKEPSPDEACMGELLQPVQLDPNKQARSARFHSIGLHCQGEYYNNL